MTYNRIIRFLAYAALALPALPPVFFPFFEPYTFGKTVVFEIIVEAMALVWLMAWWDGGKQRNAITGDRAAKTLVLLTMLSAISALVSVDISASFWGSSARMDGYFTFIHFVAFFLMLATTFTEYAWRQGMYVSVYAGTFAALYGIAQWLHAPFVVPSKGDIFGTLGNPSYLSLYCLFTIFLAHYCAQREQKREYALLLYCAAAIQAIALVLTHVQGALLALVVGTVVSAWPYVRTHITVRRGAIALTAAGMLLLLFLSSAHVAKLASFSEGAASLENRMAVWRIAVSGIAEKPLLGHGANMFEPYYLAQKNAGIVTLPTTGETFDKPHNAFLETTFSFGIIGLIAYLFFVGEIMRRALKTPALLSALVAYFIFLFFFFDTFASWLMFFFVAAFLVARSRAQHEILPETGIAPAALGISSVALIMAFFMFHFMPLYAAYFANRFLVRAAATHTIDNTLKMRALRYRSFNTPFIERAVLLTERALKK